MERTVIQVIAKISISEYLTLSHKGIIIPVGKCHSYIYLIEYLLFRHAHAHTLYLLNEALLYMFSFSKKASV